MSIKNQRNITGSGSIAQGKDVSRPLQRAPVIVLEDTTILANPEEQVVVPFYGVFSPDDRNLTFQVEALDDVSGASQSEVIKFAYYFQIGAGGTYRFRLTVDDGIFTRYQDFVIEVTVLQELGISPNLNIQETQVHLGTEKEMEMQTSFEASDSYIVSSPQISLEASFDLEAPAAAPIDFVTTWDSSLAQSDIVKLPLASTSNEVAELDAYYNFNLNWGDGSPEVKITGQDILDTPWIIEHEYAVEGVYDITINGILRGFNFNRTFTYKNSIIDVKQWGSMQFGKAAFETFKNCENLDISATDSPDLTSIVPGTTSEYGIVGFIEMFEGCDSLVGLNAFQTWDVSHITHFDQMFYKAPNFNADLSSWQPSEALSMQGMFGAQSGSFGLDTFNADLSSWDVSKVEVFSNMFGECSAFNADLSGWQTDSAKVFNGMFYRADSFDQDLGSWNISELDPDELGANGMFGPSSLSTANYDALLIGWEGQSAIPMNIELGVGDSTYTAGGSAESARTNLINTYNWTIGDGGPVI